MRNYLRYSASLLATLLPLSFAQAQGSPERPGGANEAPGQKGEPKGDHKPATQGQKNEKGTGGAEPKGEPKGGTPNDRQRVQNQPEKQEPRKEQPAAQAQSRGGEKPAADNGSQRPDSSKERDRSASESKGSRVNINVTSDQKTRVREIITTDRSIRRINRAEINFNLAVGTRIPETVVYYDAPPSLIRIIPDVERYKVIVLDDVILVVDPDTREIIDVINIS